MVLHEIKAPFPVDDTFHRLTGGQRAVTGMYHPALTLMDFQNLDAAQRAGVPGLPTALGVEGGLRQQDLKSFFAGGTGLHLGKKSAQVGVCFI